jgi:hypothetical protein
MMVMAYCSAFDNHFPGPKPLRQRKTPVYVENNL